MMNKLLPLILLLGLSSALFSQDKPKMRFQGFLDSYHALGVENDGDFLSSRSRFRGELLYYTPASKLFFSVNYFQNYIVDDLSEIMIREAYLYHRHKNWSMWLGRQIITFGQSDGLPITDLISPLDLVEFLARDYDDIRMGVDGVRLNYSKNNMNLDMFFVPVSQFNRLPIPNTPWGVDLVDGLTTDDYVNQLPEKNIKNSELGFRSSFYKKGLDFSFTVLHTWDKQALFLFNAPISPIDRPTIDIVYHRLNLASFDFAKPIKKIVLKGEFSYYFDKTYQTNITGNDQFRKTNAINGMLGLDYMPGKEWLFAVQYQNEHILDYSDNYLVKQDNQFGTVLISKKVMRNTLLLSSQAFLRFTEKAAFNRLTIDYTLTNEIHVSTGYDLFIAKKADGLFYQYKDNDEIWVKFKYSF
ncbi:MAG: hypothetical protein COA88_02390 [Kordia sp.]|nr:MAG: hypothetical protein COA88_02390 [Kordia sp.]